MVGVGAATPRALKRLFVGNIPWTISSRELKQHFSKFGFVQQTNVIFNKRTGFSRGYGFVQFAHTEGFESSLKITKHELDGYNLTVQPATEL